MLCRSLQAFAKALALDPQCEEAVMAAVNLNAAERNYQGAIELLQPLLRKQRRDVRAAPSAPLLHRRRHGVPRGLAGGWV